MEASCLWAWFIPRMQKLKDYKKKYGCSQQELKLIAELNETFTSRITGTKADLDSQALPILKRYYSL